MGVAKHFETAILFKSHVDKPKYCKTTCDIFYYSSISS